MKGTKIDTLARVEYLGQTDGITAVAIVALTLLSTGEEVVWKPNLGDFEFIKEHIAPIQEGDELAIQAFRYARSESPDSLKKVRFCYRGRYFRGMKFHIDLYNKTKKWQLPPS